MDTDLPCTDVIAARNISVAFGATQALKDVTIVGRAGSIHAVTGENGAGKSTLMKTLAGVLAPDEGHVEILGNVVRLTGPADASRQGVSTVFQELALLPNLTIAENLFLAREPGRWALLDSRLMVARASQLLAEIGVELDPRRLVDGLSVGEQQLVEIAKGVSAEAAVFIFDEPTAALNRVEVQKLGHLVRSLRDRGRSILYISHRLEEIFDWCDIVTVLKDGKHVATMPTAAVTRDELVTAMVGRPIRDLFPPRGGATTGVALDVRRLVPIAGNPTVTLKVRRGEIVGIAGLEGQGQREIMRALAGVSSPVECDVRKVDTEGLSRGLNPMKGTGEVVRMGVGFVPQSRKSEGLFLDLSILENLRFGLIAGRKMFQRSTVDRNRILRLIETLQLASKSPHTAVASLSGGNQQKVMLGRWLIADSDVLLIEEPTRGVDVGAKVEIYRLLRQFASQGGAVLLTSSEMVEMIGLCDRILVICNGEIAGEFDAVHATEEALLICALPSKNREMSAQRA